MSQVIFLMGEFTGEVGFLFFTHDTHWILSLLPFASEHHYSFCMQSQQHSIFDFHMQLSPPESPLTLKE